MAILQAKKRPFKPQKILRKTWDSFREGLNTTLRDSELGDEQAKELTNLIMDGKGYLTQRPGTKKYFQAGTNGKVRGIFGSKISGAVELLSVTDDGYLVKQNGVGNTVISGASWASGAKVRFVQLQGVDYLVQENHPLVRYDGTTLLSFTTLSAPTNLSATNLSGVSGTYTWSWRVATLTDAGRSLASDPIVVANLPEDLVDCPIQLSWTAPSSASGLIKGYEIYGREQGAETRMTGVQSTTTQWLDDGTLIPSQIAFMPDFNETGGPNAKYIIKSGGKIILGNIQGRTSDIMWSGADSNVGKFHWTKGGGTISIEKDDGTEITDIWESSENKIIVFKERSIYQVKLTYNSDLGIVEPEVQKITDALGCLSGDTVRTVENDGYFIGRRAGGGISLNSLGYQPNILANVLRTAELSAPIRPTLDSVNRTRFDDMWAIFYDQRYWWFYPVGTSSMSCITYDYERRGFSGPHTFPNNPVAGTIFYDESDTEHFLYGNGDDGYVTEINKGYSNDDGVDFSWSYSSKKEDFNLPFQLKTLIRNFYHFADVSGTTVNVAVYIEDDEGNTTSETSFSVTAPTTYAGWGSFRFGTKKYGSSSQASTNNTNTTDIRKFVDLNTPNVVNAQVRVSGTGGRCKIIAVELQAREQKSLPSAWKAD